jgi:leader peptidase (prepilin peptidase) / N-methyltransferase
MSAAPWPLLVVVGVLGLAIGSFLNVVIYRAPRGESLAYPGSHCPRCRQPIRARHNVPVLGWVILHGRCADCELPISPRYPIVEATTAALMVFATARVGYAPALAAYLFSVAAGITLLMIAVDLRRLPDRVVLPAYVIAELLIVATATDHASWTAVARAVVGPVVLCAVWFALQAAFPSILAIADVKVAGFVGIYLGWVSWTAVAFGSGLGLVVGLMIVVAVTGLRTRASNLGCELTAPTLAAPHRRSTPWPH